MREALAAKDPSYADWLEKDFLNRHIGLRLFQAEAQLQGMRDVRYTRLTPLRATDLFAEIYSEAWSWRSRALGTDVACELDGELADATTEVMKDLWRARQQADALGMGYDEYVHAVFDAHEKFARGLPRPSELHGPGALASALMFGVESDRDDLADFLKDIEQAV